MARMRVGEPNCKPISEVDLDELKEIRKGLLGRFHSDLGKLGKLDKLDESLGDKLRVLMPVLGTAFLSRHR